MTRSDFVRALALLALGATAARAQSDAGGHAGHAMPADAGSPSTAGFEAASARMHEGMAIAYTGNADVDFARGMIPHHQGAIDMATVVLEYGSDPDIRELAEGVIAAQQAEIAFLEEWLAAHG